MEQEIKGYKYNFTFIIPHKNLPNLLKRCVASIPKRSDVQILIVDDNSDPEIVDFEKFPCKNEGNVEVIFDKSGKRQGHARNIGIDKAEGKWLIFADSDDYFFYNLNKVLDEYRDSEADIVYFMATLLDNDTYLPCKSQNCLPNESVRRFLEGVPDGEHYVRFRYPAPWGKFIKSSLVRKHNIRFAEIERLEDAQFSYQCGYYAETIKVNPYSIYCYVDRPNTVTKHITPESSYGVIKVCVDCMQFLLEKGLLETPTFRIMSDLVFDNLQVMRHDNSELFEKSKRYIIESGFSEDFIKNKLRRQTIINLKTKLISKVRLCRRH